MFKSIRSRLALSFAAIALLAALVLGVALLAILQSYYSKLELTYLLGNAKAIGTVVSKMTTGDPPAPHDVVQSQIENLSFLSQTRVQIYDSNKVILYDSGSPQKVQVNLGAVKQKVLVNSKDLTAPSGSNIQVFPVPLPKPTDSASQAQATAAPQELFIYRSVQASGSPFGFDLGSEADTGGARSNVKVTEAVLDPRNGQETGTIVLSDGPAYGRDILTSVARGWALASAVAILLAAGVGWFISRRISAPVLALTAVTTRMAAGDWSSRADVKSKDELGRLARSYNQMADQVGATITALRRFVSDAAHELHTPLTALRTNLDLAADANGEADRQVFLERAQALVQRIEELNNNLLDLSRLEANGHAAKDKVVDLAGLVRGRGEAYASEAEQAGLTLELDLPAMPVSICGDAVQVQRAIDNLVGNAVKFTPTGGMIDLRLAAEDGKAVLSVSDSGIGVPEEDLPQLFNRFHRGRNATAYPGSGLGLAIVKAIMEQEGGEVTAENIAGGARFTLKWSAADHAA